MTNQQLEDLITRVMQRQASITEQMQLRELLSDLKDEELNQALDQAWKLYEPYESPFSEQDSDVMRHQLMSAIRPPASISKIKTLWYRMGIAGSVLLALGAGYYMLRTKADHANTLMMAAKINPVRKGVSLKLSNGQVLQLANGNFSARHTTDGAALRQQPGHISYIQAQPEKAEWHTLTNNSAGKYELTLNDGTEVYLDIASSITYPTTFAGKDRQVVITGQTYFKVKHNKQSPFRVKAGNQTIEDIGTEFNINAYQDGAGVTTTLVEGAVQVQSTLDGDVVTLKPGQLAQATGKELEVKPADLEAATAWLQGKLVFHRQSLESILKNVARIYDVQIVWQDDDLKNIECGGSLSRTKTLANIFSFISEIAPVDFILNGKTVIVLKSKK